MFQTVAHVQAATQYRQELKYLLLTVTNSKILENMFTLSKIRIPARS